MPPKMSLKLPPKPPPPAPARRRARGRRRWESRRSRSLQSRTAPPARRAGSVAAGPSAKAAAVSAARRRLRRRGIDVVRVEAELVIDLALLLVAQHVVRFRYLLELLFRLLVVRIHVRVVLAREFAEGLADLVRIRPLLHPQRAVVILGLCVAIDLSLPPIRPAFMLSVLPNRNDGSSIAMQNRWAWLVNVITRYTPARTPVGVFPYSRFNVANRTVRCTRYML